MGAPLNINEEKKSSAMGCFFFQTEEIKKPPRLDKRCRIKLHYFRRLLPINYSESRSQ